MKKSDRFILIWAFITGIIAIPVALTNNENLLGIFVIYLAISVLLIPYIAWKIEKNDSELLCNKKNASFVKKKRKSERK